jgi:PAS domain S-box-containing protein
LIESVRDYAIFMLDIEGRVATWNRGAEAINQYSAEEIVGHHIATFFTREDRAAGKPQRLLSLAIRDGRVEDEGWRVRKDGKRFWAEATITALNDDGGALVGFAKVTRDLTTRKIAEDRLRQSEQKLRLMVESVRDYAIFMLDPGGNVVSWNSGAQAINGYVASEVIGSHVSRFYTREDLDGGLAERELRVAATEGRFETEGWRIRKDGTRFWASVVLSSMRDETGRLVGYTKVTRDLTEKRHAEQEVMEAELAAALEREKAKRAEEAVRERDVFLSVAAHELRTPLTALQLKLQTMLVTLQKALPPEHVGTAVSRIGDAIRQSDRLAELVERLLDVSRIAAHRFELSLEETDLKPLLEAAVSDLRSPSQVINLVLEGDCTGCWDRRRLDQVVLNLLSNAVKYGRGNPIDVSLSCDDQVKLVVKDRGIGIAQQDKDRIFGLFERAVPMQNFGGLGLGLYITRYIVEAHGGTIELESQPEVGTTVTVTLPKR